MQTILCTETGHKHEYERVIDNCQMAADDKGLTVEDVANELDLDFSDLGADIDKIAE